MWLNQIYFLFYFKHSLYSSFITQKNYLRNNKLKDQNNIHFKTMKTFDENFLTSWNKRGPSYLLMECSPQKNQFCFSVVSSFTFQISLFILKKLVCFEWKDDNHSISDDIFITQVVEHKSPHPQLTLLFRKLLRVEQLQHTCYTTMRM